MRFVAPLCSTRTVLQVVLPASSLGEARQKKGAQASLSADDRVGRKSAEDQCARSAGPVQRADLIAGRIAQVGEIEFASRTLAPTGRILDAVAAAGDASIVEGLHLLGAAQAKPMLIIWFRTFPSLAPLCSG